MEKTFEAKSLEPNIYKAWEDSGCFAADPKSNKPKYCIIMPPPNVTGSLHLGHALNHTLQDILVRFKRMSGHDVLWQPGTDHAGIATQIVVDRNLAEQGLPGRRELGREKFLAKVWEWKEHSGGNIGRQLRRLGISPDWERERFTLDEGVSKAVRKVFIELYEQGLIYKDKRLANWDPKLKTAISDIEVVQKESKGYMWHIKYPYAQNPDEGIVVATTRPETMFGDMVVAVHPEDKRYQDKIGMMVELPLTGRQIPIIADEYCDPEKGTGAVKITPAHDFNDFEVGQRHNLELLNILDDSANLNNNVPEKYRGLSVKSARKQVLEDLEGLGLLMQEERVANSVPYGDRSGEEIQPWLTEQWFVDAHTLAQPAIKAVQQGETKFLPERWSNTYYDWLNNIQPWCISRQLWWGHRIPAWYGPDGKFFVAEDEAQALARAKEHYGKEVELSQDEDVLDTWFSSALWPFSTLGWPAEPGADEYLGKYYPTSTLVTGFDIIFFWVARMMMMGLHFMKEIPFDTVVMHALVRDEKGQKMSKSKGNIIDPIELMDEFGTDSLRFTLAALAVPGRDVKLGKSRVAGYRNFMTKIWNAARFMDMNNCSYDSNFDPRQVKNNVHKWMVSEVANLAHQVYKYLDESNPYAAAHLFYQFMWGKFCDYYLEFLKPLFSDSNDGTASEARQAAAWSFVQLLHIAQPFIPFITEELWQKFGPAIQGEDKSAREFLMLQEWPEYGAKSLDAEFLDKNACEEVSWLIALIDNLRSVRTEFNLRTKLSLQAYDICQQQQHWLKQYESIILSMGRVADITTATGSPERGSIQFVIGATTFAMPVGDAVDLNAELSRLQKSIDKLAADIKICENQLANKNFVSRAKPEVVEEVRERLSNTKQQQDKLKLAVNRLK